MFHWNDRIYMDEKVKTKPAKYRKMVEKKRGLRSCYCITLPMNEKNCMDIYSTREFWFQYYRKQDVEIIGLAADRIGAEEILQQIMGDIYAYYGTVNAEVVKKYFGDAE